MHEGSLYFLINNIGRPFQSTDREREAGPMGVYTMALGKILGDSGFAGLTWGNVVMLLVAFVMLYLAIRKNFILRIFWNAPRDISRNNIHGSRSADGFCAPFGQSHNISSWSVSAARSVRSPIRGPDAWIQRQGSRLHSHNRRSGRPHQHIPYPQACAADTGSSSSSRVQLHGTCSPHPAPCDPSSDHEEGPGHPYGFTQACFQA